MREEKREREESIDKDTVRLAVGIVAPIEVDACDEDSPVRNGKS